MATAQDPFLYLCVAVSALLPFAGIAYAFLSRQRVRWTKIVTVIACVPGIAWATIQWIIMHWTSYHLSRVAYYQLVGWRGVSAGLFLGIYITIAIARRDGGPSESKSQ
jgi:drug/metabolite transporter (DMT)-like permease